MECLDNIIGLSETDCECLEEGRPSDYNVSKSGIYLDRLEGFNIEVAGGADGCATGDTWARMAQAVEDAKLDFKNDLMGCIGQNYRPRFNNYRGQLGQSTFKKTINLNAQYAGMRLKPVFMRGGYIMLNKIGVLVNQSAPVTVQVYRTEGASDESEGTLLFSSTPINTTADVITWANLSTPLELPMWSENGTYVRYYVLMVLNGTFKPKDNKSSCGCGSRAAQPYDKWVTFNGVSGDDVTNFSRFNEANNLVLNGIAVHVDLLCKAKEIICSDYHPLDYDNDGNALNMAYAIRFKAGVRMYEYLLSSGEINRFNLLNREYCAGRIKYWAEIYVKYIEDSCKNSNRLHDNDCLICRDGFGTVIKQGIKV
jgi:hypothetical protein